MLINMMVSFYMVFILKMGTQHNIYLPSESNHVMSTNGKVSHILMLITVPLAPTAGGVFFTPNTMLLHI